MAIILCFPRQLRLAACLLLLTATSPAICVAGANDEPLVVVQSGKYGFIDHHGNFIIRPVFIWGEGFWKGLGTVYVCGHYVSIDSSGNLHPYRTAAKGQLQPVRRDAKFGFVDDGGHFKIEPIFDDALPFSSGMAAVKLGEKWGFVDTTGHLII